MNDVVNNLHYQEAHAQFACQERATILAEWTAVTGMGILCLLIAETIISAVTGVLVTCLCNNRLVSGGPVFFANSFWMSRKPR